MKTDAADLTAQAELVARISKLCYEIGLYRIANATLHQQSFSVHVNVRHRGWGGEEMLTATVDLFDLRSSGFMRHMFVQRLRKLVQDLEQIYMDGMAPTGGAA
jgi:hypothetical protein